MCAGANDTANAAGPYAAVQHMYIMGLDACEAVRTPVWVLAFCGLGIVTVWHSSPDCIFLEVWRMHKHHAHFHDRSLSAQQSNQQGQQPSLAEQLHDSFTISMRE